MVLNNAHHIPFQIFISLCGSPSFTNPGITWKIKPSAQPGFSRHEIEGNSSKNINCFPNIPSDNTEMI